MGTIFLTPTIGIKTTPINIPAPYPDIPATIEPINVKTIIKIRPIVSKEDIKFSIIVKISCIQIKGNYDVKILKKNIGIN